MLPTARVSTRRCIQSAPLGELPEETEETCASTKPQAVGVCGRVREFSCTGASKTKSHCGGSSFGPGGLIVPVGTAQREVSGLLPPTRHGVTTGVEVLPSMFRHSGPSRDPTQNLRKQKRDRWAAATSVRRYKERGRLNETGRTLTERQRRGSRQTDGRSETLCFSNKR